MSIIIVRHGETALNRARIMQPLDTPLSEIGIHQAGRLADRLAALDIEKVLCSDLPRARMTAAPLLERKPIAIDYTAELRERSFGDLLGTAYADLREDVFAEDYMPRNGESSGQFRERVAVAWKRIVWERSQLAGALLVVTHNLVCGELIRNHLASDGAIPERIPNTAVTIVAAEPPHRVRVMSCTDHL